VVAFDRRRANTCRRRGGLGRGGCRLRGDRVVLVEQAAEAVATPDLVRRRRCDLSCRRTTCSSWRRPLGLRSLVWRPHRRPNHADALAAEDLVEAVRDLTVAAADEKAHRLLPPASVIIRVRACWMTQHSPGFAVTSPKWTRRFASSMKKSTYRRRNQTLSTLRKSQAMIADACARRNCDQLSSGRSVAGSIPRRLRTSLLIGVFSRPRTEPGTASAHTKSRVPHRTSPAVPPGNSVPMIASDSKPSAR
jgi:hypothetical protein